MTEDENTNRIHAEPINVTGLSGPHGVNDRENATQTARDAFIDVLRSRRMLKPGEEWVIDANLDRYAAELADKLRAHGHAEAADLIAPRRNP